MPVAFTGTRDIKIADLTRFPGNARRGNVAEIRKSIRRHGQYRAIVVRDCTDGLVILAGNHTRDALEAEGHDSARCEVITCTDDEARRVNLADNKLSDLATDDPDELAELLSYLDGDYEGTGWTEEDVDALITPPEDFPGGHGDPDDSPEPPAEPVSVLGDLYLLGPHRLLCGDATNPDHLKLVTDGLDTPGIVYTDPPYGISIVNSAGKIGKSAAYQPVTGDDSTDAAADAFRLLYAEYPGALHVWWGGNHYAGSAGLPDTSCWLVWDKENGDRTFADAELAWTNHHGAVRLLRHMWHGVRASEQGKRIHPTQKPVALAEWAFGVIDPKSQRTVVLDGFAGSGSTLIAAHQTGRTAALVECEPAYCDVIAKRFEDFTGIKPERVLPDGTTEPVTFT